MPSNRRGPQDGLFGDGGEGVGVARALGGDAAEGNGAQIGKRGGVPELGGGKNECPAAGIVVLLQDGFDVRDLGGNPFGSCAQRFESLTVNLRGMLAVAVHDGEEVAERFAFFVVAERVLGTLAGTGGVGAGLGLPGGYVHAYGNNA